MTRLPCGLLPGFSVGSILQKFGWPSTPLAHGGGNWRRPEFWRILLPQDFWALPRAIRQGAERRRQSPVGWVAPSGRPQSDATGGTGGEEGGSFLLVKPRRLHAAVSPPVKR